MSNLSRCEENSGKASLYNSQLRHKPIVRSGPDMGNIHAFIATPVNESIGRSVADDEPTRPESNLPAKVDKQLLQRFGLGQLGR